MPRRHEEAQALLDKMPHELPTKDGGVHWIGDHYYIADRCPWCKLKAWIESITIMVD